MNPALESRFSLLYVHTMQLAMLAQMSSPSANTTQLNLYDLFSYNFIQQQRFSSMGTPEVSRWHDRLRQDPLSPIAPVRHWPLQWAPVHASTLYEYLKNIGKVLLKRVVCWLHPVAWIWLPFLGFLCHCESNLFPASIIFCTNLSNSTTWYTWRHL